MSVLKIEVLRASWAASPNHGTELDKREKLAKLREKILLRDNYTCQGCGLRSERWQEMHHRNGKHRDDQEKNLETRCPLCHQLAHLPQAASSNGGTIIWLPEWTQAELHQMCAALFVALRKPQHRWYGVARSLYGLLEGRKTIVQDVMGSADPGNLAQVLLGWNTTQPVEKALEPLRLLPHPGRFHHVIDYWDAKLFPPSEDWEKSLPANIAWADLAKLNESVHRAGQAA
jgi:intracellular multiplication protein IcmJ